MKNISLRSLALLGTIPAQAFPLQTRSIPPTSASLLANSGLQNAILSLSVGGHAVCVTGDVLVPVSATNLKIDLGDFNNQTVVTNTVAELVQINSTFAKQAIQGNATVSDTYNINAKFCVPLSSNNTNSTTIQFLTHGIAFDKDYWDFAEGYSYVDFAAIAGYSTFYYDRLGTGQSDHPDPISVLQAPLQVEVAHTLVQSLRNGAFNNGQKYDRIIGVGHSFGSTITQGVSAAHPTDFDAVVLTAFSTTSESMGLTLTGFNPAIANQNQPLRFSNLSNGYLVTDTSISNQMTFFRAPEFDPKILAQADETTEPFTFPEMITSPYVVKPATSFTGPVDVVDGENDFIFCGGNCNLPTDQAALVIKELYPAASNGSQSYIIPGTGHGVNLHYTAPQAYQQIFSFAQSNGF